MGLKNHAENAVSRQGRALSEIPPRMDRDLDLALSAQEVRVHRIVQGLRESTRGAFERQDERLIFLDTLAKLLDPASTLKRGFSLTVDGSGRVIRDAREVGEGDYIVTKLSKGTLGSIVRTRSHDEEDEPVF
jgi:exodeoxyribonuclease VII large subunit